MINTNTLARAVCFAAVAMVVAWPAASQEVAIRNVTSGNRSVVIEWSRALGDTFTPAERLEIYEIIFDVPDALGLDFAVRNGDPLIARGAGANRRRDFYVRVGNPDDFHPVDEGPDPTDLSFEVSGAFQFGRNYVAVAYADTVNEGQATDPANYTFVPSLTVSPGVVQANRKTVIFQTSSDLPPSTAYSVTVSGVTGDHGESLPNGGPFNFQTAVAPVLNISEVRDDIATYRGQAVSVVGQVYIPVSSQGSPASGYIQDGSGRGINLAGGPILAAVNDRGNVVAVTGTISDTLSTVSLETYTPSVLASGQPQLGATALSLRQALDARWAGTYIEVEGRFSRVDPNTKVDFKQYTVTVVEQLFAGYRVWRASDQDTTDFSLLRSFSLLDSTWTYADTVRIFADPDSIILRGTERDPEPPEDYPGPFNGFGYVYAVTWFEATIDNTVFPRRISLEERTTPSQGRTPETVFPSKQARISQPLLADVKVVPNPYNPASLYDRGAFPGSPRIQFINLPSEADIEIYNVAGDLVHILHKESNPSVDYLDWDLKNDDGQDVAPGIYVFLAKVRGGESKQGRFVLVR